MSDEISMQDALEQARNLGIAAGKAAASWVFDGNTADETYRSVLRGIEEGDPLVLDSITEPGLRGEYGARDLCDDLGIDYDLTSAAEVDQIADAYVDEARTVFWDEVERTARVHVG